MYALSGTSIERLQGVDVRIVSIVNHALKISLRHWRPPLPLPQVWCTATGLSAVAVWVFTLGLMVFNLLIGVAH